MSTSNPSERIQQVLAEAGFPHHGFARLERPFSIDLYKAWLDKGYAGDMTYLTRHLPMKESPQLLMRQARSAIVMTANYVGKKSRQENQQSNQTEAQSKNQTPINNPVTERPTKQSPTNQPDATQNFPLKAAKVAAYARGEDYHVWLKRRLRPVIETLKTLFPTDEFVSFTDSAPVLERDLAYRAGLGWIGKNTCLIHREHGSLFFIAEIFTTLDLKSAIAHPTTIQVSRQHLDNQLSNHITGQISVGPQKESTKGFLQPTATIAQLHDFCGTCTRCLDVCPTGALVAPRELDARKCISYLTIETKETPSEDLAKKTDGWFFGCDLCQTICPWNLKVHGPDALVSSLASQADLLDTDKERALLIEDMRLILTNSNSRLEKIFAQTPLARARGTGLKRNALLVCATRNLHELTSEIESCRKNKKIEKLVIWTLRQLAFHRKEERH